MIFASSLRDCAVVKPSPNLEVLSVAVFGEGFPPSARKGETSVSVSVGVRVRARLCALQPKRSSNHANIGAMNNAGKKFNSLSLVRFKMFKPRPMSKMPPTPTISAVTVGVRKGLS